MLIGAAAASSGALVVHKLRGIALPGCGPGSDCDRAAKSVWGTLPGLDWPVSFLGFAYFTAVLAAWFAVRGSPPPALRWAIRVGALVSLGFIGVMLMENLICKYCLAAHLANFLFLGVSEAASRTTASAVPAARPARGLVAGLAVFVLATGALGVMEAQARQGVKDKYDQSVKNILAGNARGANRPADASAKPPAAPTGSPAPTGALPETGVAAQPSPAPSVQPAGFTGRYREGPEKAAIRLVMITDYQCPDCRQIEAEAQGLLSRYPGMSLSVKNFPFCTDCNPTRNLPNIHPNACWAARAAEAAGILGGNAGFWKMHRWLFDHAGSFTDPEIKAALPTLGFETAQFLTTMQSPETLRRVQGDIAEATRLGLERTPMIFINGVELEGWTAMPNALTKAVEVLADTNPDAKGPENDQPPRAADKYIYDWRKEKAMAWPVRKQPWTDAKADSPIRIQIFGDLLEPNCAEADKIIRDAMAGRDDIRYEWRYFPFDQSCNPTLPRTLFPNGCRAARAAEAAGQLGGKDAYWAMHAWVTSHQEDFKKDVDGAARAVAPRLGLAPDVLIAKMNSPEVGQIIADDANIGYRIGIPSIPRIFINGKLVAHWKLDGGFVLERIIDEASRPDPEKPLPPQNPLPPR